MTEDERLEVRLAALLRTFRQRQELLRDSLSASEVARLLGVSRQAAHDRAKNGSLLAVFEHGVWRYPIWQFDANGPDGLVPGLVAVLRALHLEPLSKLYWLLRPNPHLEGLTPLAGLKAGQSARVVDEAQTLTVH